MLFNSYLFIFLFLPTILIGFYVFSHKGHHQVALLWLIAASFFFYAWWNPSYLILLIGSVLGNYGLGKLINRKIYAKFSLILGITVNLALLGYYKYANFFVDNINFLFNNNYHLETIFLPLAISFFTFQQIAYLIDTYRGETKHYQFLHYCLFVTFFPQLIAGPIVLHKEMLPQFENRQFYHFHMENLAIGLTIFFVGLFKKVLLADGIAVYASPVFDAAEQGTALTFLEAWGGALAYTMQLYFDFSGYSDMAVGLARMFGIILPMNFYSPYKAHNIIEFWRRWHMTLSRFLRDYVYIQLGGNHHGHIRRYMNLLFTMFLGGLWHGAGWTFVLWGILHGFYLIVNHSWQRMIKLSYWLRPIAILVTFLAVVIGWVLFRAESLQGAIVMYQGMINIDLIVLPDYYFSILGSFGVLLVQIGIQFGEVPLFKTGEWIGLACLFFIAWGMPNIYQLMHTTTPVLQTYTQMPIQPRWLQWQPTRRWAIIMGIIAALAILNLTHVSEFLYFQF